LRSAVWKRTNFHARKGDVLIWHANLPPPDRANNTWARACCETKTEITQLL
jgi:hypothetical protein